MPWTRIPTLVKYRSRLLDLWIKIRKTRSGFWLLKPVSDQNIGSSHTNFDKIKILERFEHRVEPDFSSREINAYLTLPGLFELVEVGIEAREARTCLLQSVPHREEQVAARLQHSSYPLVLDVMKEKKTLRWSDLPGIYPSIITIVLNHFAYKMVTG